jgi:hypothetical protein
MAAIRVAPAQLFRSRAGRLHLHNRCSGGASPPTVRAVKMNQAAFEQAVREGKVCRCVNAYKES